MPPPPPSPQLPQGVFFNTPPPPPQLPRGVFFNTGLAKGLLREPLVSSLELPGRASGRWRSGCPAPAAWRSASCSPTSSATPTGTRPSTCLGARCCELSQGSEKLPCPLQQLPATPVYSNAPQTHLNPVACNHPERWLLQGFTPKPLHLTSPPLRGGHLFNTLTACSAGPFVSGHTLEQNAQTALLSNLCFACSAEGCTGHSLNSALVQSCGGPGLAHHGGGPDPGAGEAGVQDRPGLPRLRAPPHRPVQAGAALSQGSSV